MEVTFKLSSGGIPGSCGQDNGIMPRRLLQRFVGQAWLPKHYSLPVPPAGAVDGFSFPSNSRTSVLPIPPSTCCRTVLVDQ